MLLMHLVSERDSPYVNPTYNNSKTRILLNCTSVKSIQLSGEHNIPFVSQTLN